MSNFKIGDVVRLKSGGPPMTVEAVGPCMVQHEEDTWYALSHEMMVYCRWFARVQAGDLVVDPTTPGERFHVAQLDRIAEASGPSSSLDVLTSARADLTHAFVRGPSGLDRPIAYGPPDETCAVCQKDPRDPVHRQAPPHPSSVRGATFKVTASDAATVVDRDRVLEWEASLHDGRRTEIVSCIECGRARIARLEGSALPWRCANCQFKVKPAHANGVPPRESGG